MSHSTTQFDIEIEEIEVFGDVACYVDALISVSFDFHEWELTGGYRFDNVKVRNIRGEWKICNNSTLLKAIDRHCDEFKPKSTIEEKIRRIVAEEKEMAR